MEQHYKELYKINIWNEHIDTNEAAGNTQFLNFLTERIPFQVWHILKKCHFYASRFIMKSQTKIPDAMLSAQRHFNTENWTHSQFTDLIFLNLYSILTLASIASILSLVKQMKRYSNEAMAVSWGRLLHRGKLLQMFQPILEQIAACLENTC